MPSHVLLAAAAVFGCTSALVQPEEVFAWKEVSFTWPSEDAKNEAVKSGAYIPYNNLPLGLDKWKNKLFITVPRWRNGVAASLAYVSLDEPINKTAPLIPYPDWESNMLPKDESAVKDNHIISTFRVSVDKCDRLWVMDTGFSSILDEGKQLTKPSILIYDLKTDKLIKRYAFKDSDLTENSFFANIVVDVEATKCDDAFAYIPDLGGYGLVVYTLKDDSSWRIQNNYFHFDPLRGDLTIGGISFQWTDGLFGLALGPLNDKGDRTLYFHALASLNEFSVPTSVLKNKTVATDPHSYHLFKLEGYKGENTQTSASVFDEKANVLFLTQLSKDGLACWNPKLKLTPENVYLFAQDKKKMIFTNDIKIDEDRNLWALSDKMPQFKYEKLDSNEVNYRVFKINVDDAIAGSPCVA